MKTLQKLWKIIQDFFRQISYLVRYNWAFINGLAKPEEFHEGIAYKDNVPVPLDDIDEYTLAICKEYNIAYEYAVEKMAYTDIGVLYAKVANNKAFSNYNDYLQLDDKAKSKHVMEYGEARPYVFQVITPEEQKEVIEKANEAQEKLRSMYRNGGKLND